MEEKEVAQGLFDGGVRKTFCGKKEMYVALMAEPTFSQFSKFMPVSKKDEVSAMRTLIKDCFIEGDHELVNNNFRFLFGLMGQLTDLWAVRDDQQHPATDDLRASLLSRRQPT